MRGFRFQPGGRDQEVSLVILKPWQWRVSRSEGVKAERTATSKSIVLSDIELMPLSKQKAYSPTSFAVNTKSPCLSFWPSMIVYSPGPVTR